MCMYKQEDNGEKSHDTNVLPNFFFEGYHTQHNLTHADHCLTLEFLLPPNSIGNGDKLPLLHNRIHCTLHLNLVNFL